MLFIIIIIIIIIIVMMMMIIIIMIIMIFIIVIIIICSASRVHTVGGRNQVYQVLMCLYLVKHWRKKSKARINKVVVVQNIFFQLFFAVIFSPLCLALWYKTFLDFWKSWLSSCLFQPVIFSWCSWCSNPVLKLIYLFQKAFSLQP